MMSLRTHNVMDYFIGGLLMVAPFLAGFGELDVARNVLLLSGFFFGDLQLNDEL